MSDVTPLMKQYNELKDLAGDALLLFRMGDFYELFGPDAVDAARILEITLTSRDKGKENALPMAGVPHHAIQNYLPRLLKAGRKVAIAEQIEEPGKNKIVERKIIRTLTPGIQFEGLNGEAQFIGLLTAEAFCAMDVSTGEFLFESAPAAAAPLSRLNLRHLLVENETARELARAQLADSSILIETLASFVRQERDSAARLRAQFGFEVNDHFLPTVELRHAAAALLGYVLKSQSLETIPHLKLPRPLSQPSELRFGPESARHLDLFPETARENLFDFVNRTGSSLGARELRRWMAAPLANAEAVQVRQTAVRALAGLSSAKLSQLSACAKEVYDLERILGRVSTRLANPRDTLALGRTLALIPSFRAALANATADSPVLNEIAAELATLGERLEPLRSHIESHQKAEAPLSTNDGGIFASSIDPELARLIELAENGAQFLARLEERERARTGIGSLKVRYNRVFGYFIEVTSAHLKLVPADYQRKQTMAGAERFFTEELKKFEEEILLSSSRQKALELKLFKELLEKISAEAAAIAVLASRLGAIDAFASLASLAEETGWSFPELDDSLDLELNNSFHPLVSRALRDQGGAMVPNDLRLDGATRGLIITGPNMGGKSTLMRQLALAVLLGQMGAPVPASRARWGVFSSIFTRIGANDAIARGQSTFMVEMAELAHLVHHADERSLILLDEIGRGTSTFDGISVAWATLEHLSGAVKPRLLFATHYHELTELARALPTLKNVHVGVDSAEGRLRFLYKLQEGPTGDSFGIQVAQMAGLPAPLIARAWQVLSDLEKREDAEPAPSIGPAASPSALPATSTAQLSLFDLPENPALGKLRGLRIEALTPLEALNALDELKRIATSDSWSALSY